MFFGAHQMVFSKQISPIGINKYKKLPTGILSLLKNSYSDRKTLEAEIDVLKYSGYDIPEHIHENEMEYLSALSFYKRTHYLRELYRKERSPIIRAVKMDEYRGLRKIKLEQDASKLKDGNIVYGLWRDSMYAKYTPKVLFQYLTLKYFASLQDAQNIVIDCGFEAEMNDREINICVQQIHHSFTCNRSHKMPFDLHLCNVYKDSKLLQILEQKHIPMLRKSLTIISHKSYLDFFPKDKLLYLSPNAHSVMHAPDPECVYILGGIVEKGSHKPYTLARAKQDGIKAVRFPFHRYVKFQGTSTLGISDCMNILLDVQSTDWNKAFQNIPSYLLKYPSHSTNEKRLLKRRTRQASTTTINLLKKLSARDEDS